MVDFFSDLKGRLFLFIAFLSLILLGAFQDYQLDENSFNAESLKMTEKYTGLTFPMGSRGKNLFFRRSKCIDPSFIAKIEIPLASINSFSEEIKNIKGTKITVTEGDPFEREVNWWGPNKAAIIIEKYFYSQHGLVHVFLCQETEKFVLYIKWYCG